MGAQYRLDDFGRVVLDASGNGRVALSPNGTERWHINRYAVSTSQGTNTQPIPLCTLYTNSPDQGNEYDITYTGNADGGDGDLWLEKGQKLWAVWAGGIPGTTAVLSIFGERVLY